MKNYFRMMEMMPNVMDHLAINMTHSLPSPHHFHEILKKIGSARVQAFFNEKVNEARQLGLIRDRIHIWDGQFHENWLKDQKPRKPGLEPFYGGVYNHGGKKVGVGVQESTIMDWNGTCTIPIFTEIVPANKNDNIIARGSFVMHTCLVFPNLFPSLLLPIEALLVKDAMSPFGDWGSFLSFRYRRQ